MDTEQIQRIITDGVDSAASSMSASVSRISGIIDASSIARLRTARMVAAVAGEALGVADAASMSIDKLHYSHDDPKDAFSYQGPFAGYMKPEHLDRIYIRPGLVLADTDATGRYEWPGGVDDFITVSAGTTYITLRYEAPLDPAADAFSSADMALQTGSLPLNDNGFTVILGVVTAGNGVVSSWTQYQYGHIWVPVWIYCGGTTECVRLAANRSPACIEGVHTHNITTYHYDDGSPVSTEGDFTGWSCEA